MLISINPRAQLHKRQQPHEFRHQFKLSILALNFIFFLLQSYGKTEGTGTNSKLRIKDLFGCCRLFSAKNKTVIPYFSVFYVEFQSSPVFQITETSGNFNLALGLLGQLFSFVCF